MSEWDQKEWARRRRRNGAHVAYVFGDTDPRSPGLMRQHGQEKAWEIAAELIAIGNEIYRRGDTELAGRICDFERRVIDAAGDFMSAERAVGLAEFEDHRALAAAQGQDADRLRRAELLATTCHGEHEVPAWAALALLAELTTLRNRTGAPDPAQGTPIPTAAPANAAQQSDTDGENPPAETTAGPAAGGEPDIATDPIVDPGEVDGMSHGLLLAVLVKLGGSLVLAAADLATDAMGDRAGRFYGVEMVPLGADQVRLAVVNQHPPTET